MRLYIPERVTPIDDAPCVVDALRLLAELREDDDPLNGSTIGITDGQLDAAYSLADAGLIELCIASFGGSAVRLTESGRAR